MKILVINWQDIKNPLGGGAEVHFHEIFKRIAAMGHDVTLFCCEIPNEPKFEIIDGIKIIRKGKRSIFNFKVIFEYFKTLRYQNYDLIIDDINKIPFYTPIYIKEPLLGLSHHFFGKSIFRQADIFSGTYVVVSEFIMNWFYKNIPFTVVSESTLQEFMKRGFNSSNFTIIENAITQEDFPMQVCEKFSQPTITYFGRLKKYKSIDHLFYSFASIKKTIPETVLWIIGRGDFRIELEALAKKLKIEDSVNFFGFVDEATKIKLLSKSHIVVNTSMKEGWGITNIEANACGTPVVSADVPGLRDSVSVGESGELYPYGDINILTYHLLNILKNKEVLDKLSLGAVQWAKKFSWDESANKMIELCQKVVSRNL